MNEQPPPVLQQQVGYGRGLAIITMLFGGLCVIGLVAGQATRPPPPQAPQPLRGVALYKGRANFRIRSRADLHRCVVRWGYRNGTVRGTIESTAIPLVRSVPSCETQSALAEQNCNGEAAILSNDAGAIQSASACMDGYGFIYREQTRFHEIDPRDQSDHLLPGAMRIDCAEGYSTGSFDDTI